ncbi:MAG: carbonic anhydrase family protein [Gammaproteobacteria bacterium]|nr:carbonic anhydrase family protein [Gammaproteobacteria bacterium]
MEPPWGYGPENGPAVWGQLSSEYLLCAVGNRQSPIDIVGATQAEVPAVAFHYQPMMLEVQHNGHTVEVASTSENWIEVGGARYDLTQFHFHTPGEHTVAGRPFDMEIHLVHRNEEGTLAVVGVLVRRGGEHPVLDPLAEQLPQPGESLAFEEKTITASGLLPGASRMFRYEGSLTTPPCSEGVQWFVLQTPVEISDGGLAAFEAILGNNSRPVQPLNGRELLIDRDPAP